MKDVKIRTIANKAAIREIGMGKVKTELKRMMNRYSDRLISEPSRWMEMDRTPLANGQYLEVLAGNKRELYGGPCVSVRVSDSGSDEIELKI